MRLSSTGRVVMLLAVVSLVALAPGAADDARATRSGDFVTALVGALALVQVVVAGWVTLIVVASLATRRPLAPRALRRVLFVGAAGVLVATPVRADTEHSLDGLRLPQYPSVSVAPAAPAPLGDGRVVVVARGDTLWAIARDALPERSSDAAVATAVRRWHAQNRTVIGPDPDLIHPRQRLAAPREDTRENCHRTRRRRVATDVREPPPARPGPTAVPGPAPRASGAGRTRRRPATSRPSRAFHAGARRGVVGRATRPADERLDGTGRL